MTYWDRLYKNPNLFQSPTMRYSQPLGLLPSVYHLSYDIESLDDDQPADVQLPLDIQQIIFSRDPELITKGRQLNLNLRDRLEDAYLEKICRKPISKKEVLNNLSNQMFFMVEESKTYYLHYITDYLGASSLIKTLAINAKSQPYTAKMYYRDVSRSDAATDIKELISHHPFYIDSITTYDILRSRPGCFETNPNLALNETINIFNSTVRDLDFITLYQYLIGHMWLFGINYQISFADIRNSNTDIDKMISICNEILRNSYPDPITGKLILPTREGL